MSFTKSLGTTIGAVALVSAFSSPAFAGATEGLAACKSQIAQDANMSEYTRVDSRMNEMRRRGRYTYFSINVKGKNADGVSDQWTAECKARSSGKVDELQLTRVNAASQQQVAQSGS
jgi:hypothetical protein